jgi:hypothetical protein
VTVRVGVEADDQGSGCVAVVDKDVHGACDTGHAGSKAKGFGLTGGQIVTLRFDRAVTKQR